MGQLLHRLRHGSPVHRVEEDDRGFSIVRLAGCDEAFNVLARAAIDSCDADFLALPVADGHMGYERVVIIPLD